MTMAAYDAHFWTPNGTAFYIGKKDDKTTGIAKFVLRGENIEDPKGVAHYTEGIFAVPDLTMYRMRQLRKATKEIDVGFAQDPVTDEKLLKLGLTTIIRIPFGSVPETENRKAVIKVSKALGFKDYERNVTSEEEV